ncbi:major facilitator superfamily transporter [Elysia marginata]|uniref:Major facilitator superfamily transporter n=1 Tax=Elysia marginata TaxID=1093978 RepID=A0AAV4EYR9_9GAST|nr:major facilitator superfamily transporter [Elysia marginata]
MESAVWKKICILLGGILMTTPLSFTHSYGNLLPYLASYFQARMNHMICYVDPLWITTMFRSCFSLAMVFTSSFEHRFGKFPCIIAGAFIMSISVLCSYSAVREPLALTLTFGVTHGIAVGAVYPLTLKLILEMMAAKGGTAVGFSAIGPPLGAKVNIAMAYGVINPSNRDPDLRVGSHVYFSDPEIVHRVPFYFLVMGSLMVVTNIVGVTLLYHGYSSSIHDSFNQVDNATLHGEDQDLIKPADPSSFGEKSSLYPALYSTLKPVNTNYLSTAFKEGQLSEENRARSQDNHSQEKDIDRHREPRKQNEPIYGDLSPKEILLTRPFWLVWLCCFGISHSFYIHLTLFKEYGQLTIANDALLATTAMLGMAGMIIIRPSVGLISDKIGSKLQLSLCAYHPVSL